MSVVAVTELLEGEPATSADVNATLTSWNTATAAGSIAGTNIRVEGIDRRSMNRNGNVVEADTSAEDYQELVSSGAVDNTTGTPVIVSLNGGTEDMITGSTTFPSTTRLLLHASVRVTKDAIPTTASLRKVTLYIDTAATGAGPWTNIIGTERSIEMRETGTYSDPVVGGDVIPGIDQTVSWTLYAATLDAAAVYRVSFETAYAGAGQQFEFSEGVITLEALLH